MVKERVENESKKERFKRIAEKRANRVIDDIRLLSNCSNKSIYSYEEEQINKIFKTIKEQVEIAKSLFKNEKKKEIRL